MHKIECYNCHKFGHVVANYEIIMYIRNQWSLQQYQQPRRLAIKYNHASYGYCYSSYLFGHNGGEAHCMQGIDLI